MEKESYSKNKQLCDTFAPRLPDIDMMVLICARLLFGGAPGITAPMFITHFCQNATDKRHCYLLEVSQVPGRMPLRARQLSPLVAGFMCHAALPSSPDPSPAAQPFKGGLTAPPAGQRQEQSSFHSAVVHQAAGRMFFPPQLFNVIVSRFIQGRVLVTKAKKNFNIFTEVNTDSRLFKCVL